MTRTRSSSLEADLTAPPLPCFAALSRRTFCSDVTARSHTTQTVYFSPNAAGTNPLWFSLGKQAASATLLLIPTIFTLHAHPTLLPTIPTHPHVIHRLISGADLLAPGLAGPPSSLDLKEGDLIAIMATGCETPLGVGRLAVDARELKERGKRGKAVGLMHCWGDHLWTAGKTPVKIPFTLPSDDSDEDESDEDEEEPTPDMSKLDLKDQPSPGPAATSSSKPAPTAQDLSAAGQS